MAVSISLARFVPPAFGNFYSRLFQSAAEPLKWLERCRTDCKRLADERNGVAPDFSVVVSPLSKLEDSRSRNACRFAVQTPFWALIYRLKGTSLAVYLVPSAAVANPEPYEVELHKKLDLAITSGRVALAGASGLETLTDEEFRMLLCAGFNDLISRSRASLELSPIAERIKLGDFSLARGIKELIHERRQLLEGLMTQTEAIHNELARNIHDDLIGDLLYIQRLIERARADVSGGPAFEELPVLVSIIIEKLRGMSHDLSSRDVKEWGLAAAVNDLAGRFRERTGIDYQCEQPARMPDLPESVAIQTYRIVQEFFTNSWKHAQASNVRVRIVVSNTHLVIVANDDGLGIREGHEGQSGRGLSIMHERAAIIDSQCRCILTISRGATGGTELSLRIDLASEHL